MVEFNDKAGTQSEVDTGAYLLFLIFILLIMGSQNSFNNHFELLGKQINSINNLFNTFTSTANGMQALFQNKELDNELRL